MTTTSFRGASGPSTAAIVVPDIAEKSPIYGIAWRRTSGWLSAKLRSFVVGRCPNSRSVSYWLVSLLLSNGGYAKAVEPAIAAQHHASILLYHHVSDVTPATTSVSPTTFESHLAYLKQHHQVLPLTTIVDAIKNNKELPDKAVAITFDDGHRNLLEHAHPLLQAYQLPYTIFVNTQTLSTRSNLLGWDELRTLAEDGVLIANHYPAHHHLLFKAADQTEEQWYQGHRSNIIRAEQQLVANLGSSPKLFAYPYGEFNEQLQELIAELGLTGFGQHSGAVAATSSMSALPRFSAAGVYSDLKTLQVKLNSAALPIIQHSITNAELAADGVPPQWSMSIDTTDLRSSQLSCFYSGSTLATVWQGDHVQIQLPERFPAGRSRVNCTAPSISVRGRYYWYSQPFFVPNSDGSWPD